MPRNRKSIKSIQMLSEEEKHAIDAYLASNPDLKKKMESLKGVFRKHFCFGEEEIKLYIYNICKTQERETISALNDLYEQFAANDVAEFNHDSRCTQARGIIDDTIDLFLNDIKGIGADFVDILREAKRQNIDPFKLAIKTNMRTATIDKFTSSLEALSQHKYYDINTGKEDELLSKAEVKEVIEQCASLACNASSEAIQEILNLLNGLFYDKTQKAYIYDVHEIIKSAPSILLTPPETIDMAISLIQEFKGLDKAEMLYRIKVSPTIVTVNFEKVFKCNDAMVETIDAIVKSKGRKDLTPEQKKSGYAHTIADKFTFDINHLTQIEKLKLENFKQTGEILTKYLGSDNAITCLQNMTVLNAPPEFLEYMLASLVQEEKASGINLRSLFVESPYRALTKIDLKEDEAQGKQGSSVPEYTKGKKEEIVIKEFPSVFVSEQDYEKIKKRVGNKNLGLTQDLLEKMKKFEEERQARLKAEAEEAQRRLAEERRLKREAEKEKKRLSRRQARRNESSFTARSMSVAIETTPSISEKAPELSLEEKRKARIATAKAAIESLEPLPAVPVLHDVFRGLYTPIIKGFEANGYYPKLPKLHKILSSFESLIVGQNMAQDVHQQIMVASSRLHNLVYNDEKDEPREIYSVLQQRGVTGRTIIEEMCDTANALIIKCKGTDSYVSDAVRAINNSVDRKQKDFFSKTPSVNDNMILKHDDLRQCYQEYALRVDDLADDYFGTDFVHEFYNENLQQHITLLANYIKEPINPQTYNCMEMSLYVNDYFDAILDMLIESGFVLTRTTLAQLKPTDAEEIAFLAKALQEQAAAGGNALTVNAGLCDDHGIDPQLIAKICSTCNNVHSIVGKIRNLDANFLGETETLQIFYDRSKHGSSYIEVQKGDPDYSGIPAMVYFPNLYQGDEDEGE